MNRLNPQNGLCLSALHDKAYDIGLITVLPDFSVRVSKRLLDLEVDDFTKQTLSKYHGKSISLPDRFRPNPSFLQAHAARFEFV